MSWTGFIVWLWLFLDILYTILGKIFKGTPNASRKKQNFNGIRNAYTQKGSVSGPGPASIDAYVYIHAFDINVRFQNSFEISRTLGSQGIPLNVAPGIFVYIPKYFIASN